MTFTAEQLPMPDANVVLYRQFFTPQESDALLQTLTDTIAWKQESIRVPGKLVPLPRLTAWYSDEGATYHYSGLKQTPLPWTPVLSEIKARLVPVTGVYFNSVLLNLYRSETDSVNWHADDEPELGSVIASISFGAARSFQFKRLDAPKQRIAVELPHGSLLVMRGTTQKYWLHRIPKATQPQPPRINLTFRVIYER